MTALNAHKKVVHYRTTNKFLSNSRCIDIVYSNINTQHTKNNIESASITR